MSPIRLDSPTTKPRCTTRFRFWWYRQAKPVIAQMPGLCFACNHFVLHRVGVLTAYGIKGWCRLCLKQGVSQ